MARGITGNYYLRLVIGDQDVVLYPESIIEFTIIEQINRFLPSLTLKLKDPNGDLTHRLPMDKRYSTFSLEFSNYTDRNLVKQMVFKVYRRFSESRSGPAAYINIVGLLDVPNLFSPKYERGWVDKSRYDVIDEISSDDLGFKEKNINTELGTILENNVQPNWTNSQYLLSLASDAYVFSGKTGFFCYVDTPIIPNSSDTDNIEVWGNRKRFNFVSLDELLNREVKYTLANITDSSGSNLLPIFSIDPIDNFSVLNIPGIYSQPYSYFNYSTGEYVDSEIVIDDVELLSLSEYYAHDALDNRKGMRINSVGKISGYQSVDEIESSVKSKYYRRLNSLVQMWVATTGECTLLPGDVIKIVFSSSSDYSTIFSNQYCGFWLIERIVHSFGNNYITHLLLTRSGYDTNLNNKYRIATNSRKT